LAASMDALEVHRLSKAAASDSRPPAAAALSFPPERPADFPAPPLAVGENGSLKTEAAPTSRPTAAPAVTRSAERAHGPISARHADFAPSRSDLRPSPAAGASAPRATELSTQHLRPAPTAPAGTRRGLPAAQAIQISPRHRPVKGTPASWKRTAR
jgi:hypothetical protein